MKVNSDSEAPSIKTTVKVTKTQEIYNGEKEQAFPGHEWQEQQWTELYGAGPWYYITTTPQETAKNDIYTWVISYNK